jgi:FtsH-binding integral membrane protein
MYAPAVVGQAAFLTIMIFGGMTAYAFISGKNFSFMGGFLFVGIWAVILAGVGNMFFFKNVDLSYWLAWGMLLVSSGFVLYQTSNIIHEYGPRDYCAAALGLFISFFNIFTSLLHILGGNRD